MVLRYLTFLLCGLTILPSIVLADAPALTYLGDLAGGSVSSSAYDVSGDGTIVVGSSLSAGGEEPFVWTLGTGMVGLGIPGGYAGGTAYAVNDDGSLVAGGLVTPGFIYRSFYWTSGSGIVALPYPPGGSFLANVYDVSNDGSVLVGESNIGGGYSAFRWTSGSGYTVLGDFPGGTGSSRARGVSGDGSIVVGNASNGVGQRAFRWTSGTGLQDLGDLQGGAGSSYANGISDDGATIVGYATIPGFSYEAFRWMSGTGMVGLGDLPGGTYYSVANAVNGDGSVVVGISNAAAGARAFIWDSVDGMQNLETVLTDLGVDITGWSLTSAQSISDDGKIIVGSGMYSGNNSAFLANIGQATGLGSVEDLTRSLSEAQISNQQAVSTMGSYVGRGIFLARHAMNSFPENVHPRLKENPIPSPQYIEPAAGDTNHSYDEDVLFPKNKWAFYSVGSLAMGQNNNPSSHEMEGAAGALYKAGKYWVVGGGMVSGRSHIDLNNGGNSVLQSYGGEILTSFEHPNGIRLYMIGVASYLTLESSRGYVNGGGRSYSYGETDGMGYAVSSRLGYQIDILPERRFTAMPYIEVDYSHTQLDGYQEKNGAFPAQYSDQNGDRAVGRLGVEISHGIGDTVTVGGRSAYAHRLYDSEDGVVASSSGLTINLSPPDQDESWAEGGAFVAWEAQKDVHFSVDVSGRSGQVEDAYARAIAGVTIGF